MALTTASRKPKAAVPAAAAATEGCAPSSALIDSEARSDVLNRLRRAEGQLRGIQRMIEDNESCLKIGQQFSAVRKALDSTYLRMTFCFMSQERESKLSPYEEQKADLSAMMKDLETLLARMA
jgi:DNA-binding FrmR family transcriptional regulator